MQFDLALFLRLSRTLETTHSDGQTPLDAHQDVLRALDDLFVTVSERMEMLSVREAEPEAMGVQVEDLEETKELPPELTGAELEEEETPPQVWTAQHDRLYEDVLWLFKVGDNEGALISLGRLLHVAGSTPELQRFLDINEEKLVGLYERLMGPFDQPLTASNNGLGDRYFWDTEDAQTVLRLARDSATVKHLITTSPLPRMQTLALLHRLRLEGLVSLENEKRKRGS